MLRNSLLALLLCAGAFSVAQDRPEPRLITVSGTSFERTAPDLAIVRLGVVAQEPTAVAAQNRANQVMTALIQGVTALGIERREIQTTQLTLSPVYSQPSVPRTEEFVQRVVAYRATSTVTVRVRDFALIGRVVDAGMTAGANRVEGINFTLENDLEARLTALRNAALEARRKAETIAAALGLTLGEVHEVSEAMIGISPPSMMRAGFAGEAMDMGTPVEPGEIQVSAQVTVRYVIR